MRTARLFALSGALLASAALLAAQQSPPSPSPAAPSPAASPSASSAAAKPQTALAPAAVAERGPDRLVLAVPYFGQTLDAPWGGDFMGDSRALLADNGCIVCCAAMGLAGFGADTDPGRLNRALVEKGLYSESTFRGEKLGRMGFSYESIRALYPAVKGLRMRGKITAQADIEAVKSELRAGRPVILTVMFRKTYNHAILVYGYDGADLLVRDPMDPSNLTLAGYARRAGNATKAPYDSVVGWAVYSTEGK